jgi:hypothetical protein
MTGFRDEVAEIEERLPLSAESADFSILEHLDRWDKIWKRRTGYAVMPYTILHEDESPVIDFVRELRLRQWARQNFVPPASRKASWHPVVLDEMRCRDREIEAIALKDEATGHEQPHRTPHSPHFTEAADRSTFA